MKDYFYGTKKNEIYEWGKTDPDIENFMMINIDNIAKKILWKKSGITIIDTTSRSKFLNIVKHKNLLPTLVGTIDLYDEQILKDKI